ncbi:MAG: hypothetical protein AAGJ35_12745 [Myxococcota bacterium]
MTHSFNTKRAYVIPEGSVELDIMSSVDVFGDKRLLTNIRTVGSKMKIICNAEAVVVTQMGDLGGYGPVWYLPNAIANILSLGNVQKHYTVQYNSEVGDFFTLKRKDGSTRVFHPTKKGLYASQLLETKQQPVMVTTVAQNMDAFTKREIKMTEKARRMMAIIGRPKGRQIREIVMKKQLPKCDITEQYVRKALTIFGPNLWSLKGKTTRGGGRM